MRRFANPFLAGAESGRDNFPDTMEALPDSRRPGLLLVEAAGTWGEEEQRLQGSADSLALRTPADITMNDEDFDEASDDAGGAEGRRAEEETARDGEAANDR